MMISFVDGDGDSVDCIHVDNYIDHGTGISCDINEM